MDGLKISLFGSFRLAHQQSPETIHLTPIIQILFAYLLLNNRHLHPREVLTGIFWGDLSQDKARGCLNTALWRLRRSLEPEGIPCGTYLLTNDSGEVGFNSQSNYWLDVSLFKDEVSQVTAISTREVKEPSISRLEAAVELYQGDLLEGVYEDWTLREREYLRMLYLHSLSYLMRYYHRNAGYLRGLAYGKQILALEPLREEVHRDMMRIYWENGQRALAVQQYEQCRAALANELGIEPMEETQRLYRQILQDHLTAGDPAGDPTAAAPGANQLDQALDNLREALQTFNHAKDRLDQAIDLMQQAAQKSK